MVSPVQHRTNLIGRFPGEIAVVLAVSTERDGHVARARVLTRHLRAAIACDKLHGRSPEELDEKGKKLGSAGVRDEGLRPIEERRGRVFLEERDADRSAVIG